MPQLLIIITALSLSLATSAQAEIYSWKDASGNTIYTDQKPSTNAKPTASSNTVNYYTEAKPPAQNSDDKDSVSNTLATLESVTEKINDEKMTVQQCQELYATSCDQIENWMQYALEQCGNDSRCQDPEFLDKKYRPRSLEEMQAIARRAGVRNNLQAKKISQFLNRKYGNQCETQAKQYCQSRSERNCENKLLSYCKETRSLNDIFARYDNLNALEREQIIAEAKALALANGGDPTNYDQLISGLIDILLSQALMGI